MHTALSARARQIAGLRTPVAGIPHEIIATLRLPWYGCDAGRQIANESDVSDLWQTMQNIVRTRRAYCAAIGMTDEAKTQQALKPNSEFPADAEPVDSPSSLPEEERHRNALEAWDNMSARIYAVHPLAVRYILAVVVRDEAMGFELTLPFILREMVK